MQAVSFFPMKVWQRGCQSTHKTSDVGLLLLLHTTASSSKEEPVRLFGAGGILVRHPTATQRPSGPAGVFSFSGLRICSAKSKGRVAHASMAALTPVALVTG